MLVRLRPPPVFDIQISSHVDDRYDGRIVIDEVAGQWLALIPLPLDPGLYLLAFLAFRLFDILKPWPVGWADRRLPGAFGIMADDLLAGLYAGGLVFGVSLMFG